MTRLARPGRTLAHVLTRHHVPEAIVVILALTSIGLGLDMVLSPPAEYARPAFERAMSWGPASSWGVLLIVPSGAALATLTASRRDLYWPLFAMTSWYSAWSLALVLGTNRPGAVNSAAIIYSGISTVLAVLALTYLREGSIRRQERS